MSELSTVIQAITGRRPLHDNQALSTTVGADYNQNKRRSCSRDKAAESAIKWWLEIVAGVVAALPITLMAGTQDVI